jgi:DNA-binding transcriptional MerR regulator
MPVQPAIRSGELARRVGVSRDTLRYYERKGLLPAPQRSNGGYRLYSHGAIQRLRVIRGALALGFTIQELAAIFHARDHNRPPCRQVRELAMRKAENLRLRIAELVLLRKELLRTVKRWEQILDGTAPGSLAHLLEAFVAENPEAIDRISPLISPGLQQKLLRAREKR